MDDDDEEGFEDEDPIIQVEDSLVIQTEDT